MGIIFALISFNAIFFFVWDNLRRAKKKFSLTLRPNCLLSPHPFVFLGGKKSIFYFMAYWGDLPKYLAEHGYEIFHWNSQHLAEIEKFFAQQERSGKKFHLLLDASNQAILEQAFRQKHYTCVKSCVLIGQENPPLPGKASQETLKPLQNIMTQMNLIAPRRSWIWRLHQAWTRQDASLDLRNSMDYHSNKENFELILEQFIAISEHDFYTDEHTTGETIYDESSDRPAGDFSRFAELS